MSKLPDDGDPWAPNNLLTPEQKKNTSWTPVGQATLVKPYMEASEDVGVLSPQGEAEGCVMYGALFEPDTISNDNVQRILILLFLETGYKKSSNFKYWIMLLEAIQILLECIKAERTGNWKAHLVS